MSKHRYLQLDVFAGQAGSGNPLGVVFNAETLSSEQMQQIAAWLNLSETIFFLPVSVPDADYHIRIFTPRAELPFAGHPSVGAAWAAVTHGVTAYTPDGQLRQQCAAGVLPVEVVDRHGALLVRLRAPRARAIDTGDTYADALHAACAELRVALQPAALWNNGPNWWLLELADAQAVRQATPDLAAIARLSQASAACGLAIYAPLHDGEADLVVRAFCPGDGIPEDPVTGSANACIGARLHGERRLPGAGLRYIASQGREVGRDGRVHVEVDDQDEVWIGGTTLQVIDGRIDW
ncbi:TPA: PhzF family phenazine biosynthesis protein [Xanthomonas vasicola pv. zeae]|uniref:PhzF family phenazine biosynthesis protein n=1 Tax=Xanthomonas vasicola pv. vasculorum TaxID=325776 RepID=A0AAE8F3D9_XANVA|nr:PhzF family phenazine biosynthesis protein [Xanthomonas vasicola]AVQ07697.1 PhzF family phenazine biosynthesis protein [Xanthomonas vasicola pv. vasculorum]AZM71895.1 PhzF family phenazine biosynthesis protein [Xanthomonas vasicola pv. vasculorum]MDO6956704.1 PhzF family phenazine biosynthesis protein [Xanthomonas vasicola]MDO6973673.1 PhzF family phenazine biosynthesis protein [Xanthomonas vasicola]OWF60023.1 phenazine biosynthesis protein [Xanthomonas vasicola pv. vasculorum]